MLLLSILYWLPMVLVAIICVAIVGKVRAGRYKKEWMGYPAEAPAPASAVAQVMTPIVGVLLWAFAEDQIGIVALGSLAVGACVLGYFVYVAAMNRHSEGTDG